MKTALVNGSPRVSGTTAFALGVIAETLEVLGVQSEIVQIGNLGLQGCVACGACAKSGNCVVDDGFAAIADKIHSCDGLVIGSPVYYAGINGSLKSFLDRLFYSGTGRFRFKPAAAAVAMRRAGGTAARQSINHYFEFAEMLITPTHYWSAIHGLNGAEAAQDAEGVQQMQVIAQNMAFLLKTMQGKELPAPVSRIKTNFIRPMGES